MSRFLRNQQESPLLRLPIELRELIWTYAFALDPVHPTNGRWAGHVRRMRYGECRETLSDQTIYELGLQGADENDAMKWKNPALHDTMDPYFRRPTFVGMHRCTSVRGPPLNVSVPLVCKQLYDEALPLMWKSTTFCFSSGEVFFNFSRAPNARPQLVEQLSINLKAGHLSDWEATVTPEVLASFPALRGLHLILDGTWDDWKSALTPQVLVSFPALRTLHRALEGIEPRPPTYHQACLRGLPRLIQLFQHLPLRRRRTTAWMVPPPTYVTEKPGPDCGDWVEQLPMEYAIANRRLVAEVVRELLLQYRPREALDDCEQGVTSKGRSA